MIFPANFQHNYFITESICAALGMCGFEHSATITYNETLNVFLNGRMY